jgi:hypothetical protein
MKVAKGRQNLFTLTATSQEIGALVAAARLALDVLRADPSAPQEAIRIIEAVIGDWERAMAGGPGEGQMRPPGPGLAT